LANNSFSPIIGDYSFNSIKGLKSLNLSLNDFESLEDGAFMLHSVHEATKPYPLSLIDLDLSKNNFHSMNWNSIQKLSQLQYLWLNNNPLQSLDFLDNQDGDQISINKSSQSGIIELYVHDCSIDYINPLFLRIFNRLRVLDLHNNKLKHLSYQIPTYTNFMDHLIIHNNPLICDCRIRWLSIFLQKKNKNNKDNSFSSHKMAKYPMPTCSHQNYDHSNDDNIEIATTHHISIQTDQIKYDNEESETEKNSTKTTTIYQQRRPRHQQRRAKLLNILQLTDDDFMCELELTSSKVFNNHSNSLILECQVATYPAAYIWWTYGERVFGKINDNTGEIPNYEIKDFPIKKELSSREEGGTTSFAAADTYTFKTQLHINNFKSQFSGNFYCRTMHQLQNYQNSKMIKNTKKAVVFKIQLLYSNGDIIPIENDFKQPLPAPYRISQLDSSNNNSSGNNNPFIYWLMLAICVIFSLTVIIFVSICIIRSNIKYKKNENIYMSSSTNMSGFTNNNNNNNKRYSPSSTGYYSIVGNNNNRMYIKNDSTYSSSTTNSAYAHPLKPDVIREHRESSTPTYTNLNFSSLSSASRNSTPYSNITFKTNMTRLQSSSLDDHNDCEDDQVQTSLIDDDVSVSLSRSFDENFEAYQDPKFDDLRKPNAHYKQQINN
jgi:hypothetical protein